MLNNFIKKTSLSIMAVALLIGCGGSTGDAAGDTVDFISGKAVDGYISGATVFLDLNKDGKFTTGEPTTKTDSTGSYFLNLTNAQKTNKNFASSEIIVYGGIDNDTKKEYKGKLKAVNNGKSTVNATTITTQIAALVSDDINITEAKAKVRQALNIPTSIKLDKDPIEYLRQNINNKDAKNFLAINVSLHKAIDTLALAAQKDNNATKLSDISDKIVKALALGIKDINTTANIGKVIETAVKNDTAKNLLGNKAVSSALAAAQVAYESKKAFKDINTSASDFNVDNAVAMASIKSEKVKDQFKAKFEQDDFDFNITIKDIQTELNFKAPTNIDLKTEQIKNIAGVNSVEAQIIKKELSTNAITKENIDKIIKNDTSTKIKVDTNQTAIPEYAPNEVIVEFKDTNSSEQTMDNSFKQMNKDMVSAFKQMDNNLKTAMNQMDVDMNATFKTVFGAANISKFGIINQNFINLGVTFVKSSGSNKKTTKELIEMLKDNPHVKSVTPNYTVQISSQSGGGNKIWAIENNGQYVNNKIGTADADMDVTEAWEITKGNKDVVVAVIDTGVDYLHEDLSSNMVEDGDHHGYDFAGDDDGNNDDNPMPDTPYNEKGHYHGTHVAGTIAATDNTKGIVGIAPNVKILALKVFRPKGYGYTNDILEAYNYVAQKKKEGMNIVAVNASYGTSSGKQTDSSNKAIKKLADLGIVFCAAAGNDGEDNDEKPHYPSSYDADNIISVAASDQDDKLASFSNYGKNSVDVAAPGTNIYSTFPSDTHDAYAFLQGTSMATPNVTGAIALIASKYPNKTALEWKNILLDGVDVKSQFNGKLVTQGRVNVNTSIKSKNTPPIANNDKTKTAKNTAVTIDVLANDSDKEGDRLTISSVENPSHGTATIENNKIKYTPNSDNDFSGTDKFKYTITDGSLTDTAIIEVEVQTQSNHPPVAKNDNASTKYETKVTIKALANDTDADGDTLTITKVAKPSTGIAKIVDNKIEYTPKDGQNAQDTFSYTISDGVDEANATITVTVGANSNPPANTAPVAQDDNATTQKNVSIIIDVLANDSDKEGDRLTISSVENPSHGTATIENNKIKYTPNSDNDFSGTDTFTYTITDGNLISDANVTITVTTPPVTNTAPDANDDKNTTAYQTEIIIDVLANDTDKDGDTLTVSSVENPSHGTATIENNKIKYTPNNGFSGTDKFYYTVTDGKSTNATDEAKVTIIVSEKPNTPPVANDDNATTNENRSVDIDILANDTDEDGDRINLKDFTQPSHGKVSKKYWGGDLQYTPDDDYNGTDRFTYTITDGTDVSSNATVTITIEANDDGNNNGGWGNSAWSNSAWSW